jgi:hypothetical protein
MNHHPRSLWIARAVSLLAFFALVLATGCVGTGADRHVPTPTQLAAMDDAEWASYLKRVEAWAIAAGYSAVEAGADQGDVVKFAEAVAAVTDTEGDWLAELAARAGLSTPIAQLLAFEAQALIDARGGLPGGLRLQEFLHRVAGAVAAGAAQATVEARYKQAQVDARG